MTTKQSLINMLAASLAACFAPAVAITLYFAINMFDVDNGLVMGMKPGFLLAVFITLLPRS